MPKPSDVMITVPVYEPQQYEVSKFLKVKPAALGILETLIGFLGLGLTIWRNSFPFLWSPLIFISIGVITASAACTSNLCLVKSSQILSYVNTVIAVISLRFHLFYTWGVSCFILVACDILTTIFSVAVAATSCSCKPTSRHEVINYLDTDLPVNHVVLMGQPDSSALAQPVSSFLYVLPAAPGSLPNYGPVPSTPPPNYSPAPSTPPPSYEQASAAPPLNYAPNLT